MTILKTKEAKERLGFQGAEVIGSTPEAFAAALKNDIQKWARVTSGLKLQLD